MELMKLSPYKQVEKADGVSEVLIPGERAFRERAQRIENGLEIDDPLMERLKAMG